MKKKILSLILAGVMVMSMAACAVKKPGAEDTAKDGDKKDSKGGYELALITDVGTIDDKSMINLSTRDHGKVWKNMRKSMISLTNITNRQKNLMRHV